MRPLPVAYGQLPFREAWRAEALQVLIESGDMRGGFVRLAQQGFPARFPGRAESAGETRSVGKIAAGELFRQAEAAPTESPPAWSEAR